MICRPRTLSLTLSALLLVAVSAPAHGINLDKVPDFAAGCFGANKETGEVRIYSGATGPVLLTFAGDSLGESRTWRALAG